MFQIFINYRRVDSAAYAGRLYDRLAGHFGRDHIFMDIDQIAPGEDFIDVIHEKLSAVQVAVVLIGKHWLEITDEDGQRRLDNSNDFVRLEIATLLERKIRVIPILVGGALMPQSTRLPECLAPLTRRSAYEITDTRFHADVDKLIQALEKIPGVQTALPSPESVKKTKRSFFKHLVAIFGAGVLGLIVAVVLSIEQLTVKSPNNTGLSFEPEMVSIPPGKFLMGSPEKEFGRYSNEGPQQEVIIDYTFEIGKYEVTFDEYDVFAKETIRELPEDRGWGRGNRPVINVSFDDAQAYAQWLSNKTGKKYRLPTEAEWEYVTRAGSSTAYWWGDDIGHSNAVCDSCGSQWDIEQTAPVGSLSTNAFELYDTAGNVWEWTQDCWHADYQDAPVDGSAWLKANDGNCDHRMVRGGSWNDNPQLLRSAVRRSYGSDDTNGLLGFRIARGL